MAWHRIGLRDDLLRFGWHVHKAWSWLWCCDDCVVSPSLAKSWSRGADDAFVAHVTSQSSDAPAALFFLHDLPF
jgi:hypothetical protein